MTTTEGPVPTDFLDFLGREYAGRPLNRSERRIVRETWAMALVPAKVGPPTIEEIAVAHAQLTDPLLARLNFVRAVTYNTLKKLKGPVPPELAWASTIGWAISIVSIHRPHMQYSPNLTHKLRTGETTVYDTDIVRIAAPRGGVDLPLSSLVSDPMVIAQRTRAAFKKHAEQLEYDAYDKARRDQANLIRSIAGLQAELESLNEIVAVKAAGQKVLSDAIYARASAQRAERAAQRAILNDVEDAWK